ncbi:MAG TPA: Gfo/Idh/MocA family oxidoreductase [Polyangia bacterium]|nr:Gfo/Idh/MocA family oxidoreductase [Polyangia bacterium]
MANLNKKVRGALVGYGFIMESGHAAGYRGRGDVEIVAIADVSEERRVLARTHFPEARIYADHTSLLDAERTGLDFCDVAVPPADHAAVAHAALEAGVHVLCEKPLATSVEEARGMLQHAAKARRVLYPCHNYKHAPVIKTVRAAIDAGRVGKPHLVTLQTFRNTHAKGVGEWRPHWRRERRHSGGGIAMDHGSHTFYLAFEWLRAYPTAITARMETMGAFDTEDDFTCSLRFPTGVASAHLSWNAGVRKVLYTIHGDKGAIRVEDDAIEIATQAPDGKGGVGWKFDREAIPSDWMDSSHVNWFNSLFDDFKSAIARGDFVGHEARAAFLCVQLISTAYASARDGSRELPLRGLDAIEIDDVTERRARAVGAHEVTPRS